MDAESSESNIAASSDIDWSDRAWRIAERLHTGIMRREEGAADLPEVQRRLAELVEQVFSLLFALPDDERSPVVVARSIGAELADIHYLGADVLEQTNALLTEALLTELPPTEAIAMSPRLARILGGVAAGYSDQVRDAVLRRQIQVDQAYRTAHERLRDAVQEQRDAMQRVNRELEREVAERRQMEVIQREYAERLRHIHEISLAILSAQSLEEVMRIAAEHVSRLVPSLSVLIGLIDQAGGEATVLQSNLPVLKKGYKIPTQDLRLLDLYRKGQHVCVEDIRALPNPSPAMQMGIEAGGRSLLAVPMGRGDGLLGVLSVMRGEVSAFSEEEIAVAGEIAAVIALAFQNQRLLQAEQKARQRETTLREVTGSLTSDLELEELLGRILDRLERVVHAANSCIFLEEETGLVIVARRGLASTVEEVLREDFSRVGNMVRILSEKRPLVIPDTATWPDWIVMPGMEWIRSWLGVPLIVKDRVIGLLTLDRPEVNSFKEEDADLALAFANQAAIAIENARLFRREQQYAEQLERRVWERTRELASLYAISGIAGENLDLSDLLQQTLSEVLQVTGGDAGAIYLLSGDHQLELAARRNAVTHSEGDIPLPDRLTADHPLIARVLRKNKAWIAEPTDAIMNELCAEFRSYAAAPLRARGQFRGLISLFGRRPDQFGGDLLKLLTAVADQIGLAIDNTTLRLQARQAAIAAERERLALDLHDSVTQTLYSLTLFAEAARDSAAAGNIADLESDLDSIRVTAHQSLGELRLLLYGLRTETLAQKGLVGALQDRLANVEKRAFVEVSFETNVDSEPELPPAAQEALYWVAVEALNNSLRHANAGRVQVCLHAAGGRVSLSITDDGVGFDPIRASKRGGVGLDGMRRRMEQIGGALHLQTGPGQGARLEAVVPMSDDRKGIGA